MAHRNVANIHNLVNANLDIWSRLMNCFFVGLLVFVFKFMDPPVEASKSKTRNVAKTPPFVCYRAALHSYTIKTIISILARETASA